MQVLYCQDQRLLPAVVEEHLLERLKRSSLKRFGTETSKLVGCHRHTKQVEEIRCLHIGVEPCCLETCTDLRGDGLQAVPFGKTTALPQQLGHRQVGTGAAIGQALTRNVRDLVRAEVLLELLQEPRLAQARFSYKTHHLAMLRGDVP